MTPRAAMRFVALILVWLAAAAGSADARQLVQPPPPPTGQDPVGTGTLSGDQPPVVPPRRPYRGLFAGSEANAGAEGLNLGLAGFGGYDDNVIADQPGSVSTRAPIAGTYLGGTAALSYLVRGQRSSFGVVGISQLRFYQDDIAPTGATQSVLFTATVPVTRQMTVSLRQGVVYSPYYQASLLPDLPSQDDPGVVVSGPPNVDQSVSAVDTWGYRTGITAVETLGRSSALRFDYGYHFTDFDAINDDRSGWNAGGAFSRRMSRYATLRLGYTYQESQGEGGGSRSEVHGVDIGGGYSRPLSFSRRTTVGFSGGTALLKSPIRGNQFRVIGDATAHHEIGRSWLARAAFSQGVRYVDALPDPLYGFSTRGSIGGLINPRIELTVGGGYSNGNVDTGHPDSSYWSANGTALASFAMTETLAWYVEYVYNQYEFGSGAGLPSDIASNFKRNTVRTGITFWIPIYTPRQVNATR